MDAVEKWIEVAGRRNEVADEGGGVEFDLMIRNDDDDDDGLERKRNLWGLWS